MVIRTRAEQLERAFRDKLSHLRDHQECRFIRQLEGFVAAEAESDGLIELEQRAAWRFDSRGSPPSIFDETNSCPSPPETQQTYRMDGTLQYSRCDNCVFLTQLLRVLELPPCP